MDPLWKITMTSVKTLFGEESNFKHYRFIHQESRMAHLVFCLCKSKLFLVWSLGIPAQVYKAKELITEHV